MKTVKLEDVIEFIKKRLGNPIAIQSYADLDDKEWNTVPVGTYFTFTNGTSIPDYDDKLHPFAGAGCIEVRRYGSSSTMQILYDANAKFYIRFTLSNSEKKWSSWRLS